MNILTGPYNDKNEVGGAKAATDEIIIILPFLFLTIDGKNNLLSAITEIPKTLKNFSSSSIDVLINEEGIA